MGRMLFPEKPTVYGLTDNGKEMGSFKISLKNAGVFVLVSLTFPLPETRLFYLSDLLVFGAALQEQLGGTRRFKQQWFKPMQVAILGETPPQGESHLQSWGNSLA